MASHTAGLVALVALATQALSDDLALLAGLERVHPVEPVLEGSCKAVAVKKRTTCTGNCTGNSTCELTDPTDPTTGCMCKAGPAPLPPAPPEWLTWLDHFGHDVYQYPQWIQDEINSCKCSPVTGGAYTTVTCTDDGAKVDWRDSSSKLTYCLAKSWLIDHMPEWDKHYLPPSVSVSGASMFDDNIVFALMADRTSKWSKKLPLSKKLAFILPYATFHESRVNWRPLMFSKFFGPASEAENTTAALNIVLSHVQRWQNSSINSLPPGPPTTGVEHSSGDRAVADARAAGTPPSPPPPPDYRLRWTSSTSPPVISPFDFAAYGYGSCTAFATLHVYAARAVGIPARVTGAPCWNGGEFAGLASGNPNVSKCWHGGIGNTTGGKFLDNHNWVEYWDDVEQKWETANDPGTSVHPLCSGIGGPHGCGWSNTSGCAGAHGPSAAMQDHEIISVTWEREGDPVEPSHDDSGPIIDAAQWKLSSGEPVTPLVWSAGLTSPLGEDLARSNIRAWISLVGTCCCWFGGGGGAA